MLETSYVLLTIIMVIAIISISYYTNKNYTGEKRQAIRFSTKVALFLFGWFAYLAILSYFKLLTNYGPPPRFPIFLLLPFITFCVVFYRRNKNNKYIQSIPLHYTAFSQSFRIAAEFLLLYTFIKSIIPIEATFEGYNFDILIGISALLIGYMTYKTGNRYKRLLQSWNIIGIAMILIVATIIATSIYQPSLWGFNEPTVQKSFVQLPYLLLPGFLAPLAIVIHLVSLIQLNKETKQ